MPDPQDPPPLGEASHVGHLGLRCLCAGLGPLVVDESGARGFDGVDEGREDRESVRVLLVRDVLAVELGLHGVHDHRRGHVVDPEVFFPVVPHSRQDAQCLLLSLGAGEFAGFFLLGVVVEDAHRRFDDLTRLGRSFLQHGRADLGVREAQAQGRAQQAHDSDEHQTRTGRGPPHTLDDIHGFPLGITWGTIHTPVGTTQGRHQRMHRIGRNSQVDGVKVSHGRDKTGARWIKTAGRRCRRGTRAALERVPRADPRG